MLDGKSGNSFTKNFSGNSSKIDYKEVLSEKDFAIFAKLREVRKAIAKREAIPVFTICTNEQLSKISTSKPASITELKKIEGIGEAKASKYGNDIIEALKKSVRGLLKRAGNLIDRIAESKNIRLAYIKARKGKRLKKEVIEFTQNLDHNLEILRVELQVGNVKWVKYHSFQIRDPKPREIFAAPFKDRVAHHAIMNICEPCFENYQITDSYACRKGRGLDAALERAVKYAQKGGYYLKLDIRKYFNSIDQNTLNFLIEKRIKDKRVLGILRSVIATYNFLPGKGVPIGNLTSQFFANHYLAELDHFVKDQLRVKGYIRYMDDFVLWEPDKVKLRTHLAKIRLFLKEKLQLEIKPPVIRSVHFGMEFLGYKVFPQGLRLARRTRKRFTNKAKKYFEFYKTGIWNQNEFAEHFEPLLDFIKRGDSFNFREKNLKNFGFCLEARTA